MKAWRLYDENYSSYYVRTKVLTKFSCDLDLWIFDPKMYRYLPLAIMCLCMKYESCMLTTAQVIVSEPKCWRTDRQTDGLTWFLKGACLVAGPWKLLKLSCQSQSVNKVRLWPCPVAFWTKMYRYLPLTIQHLCMKYERCALKKRLKLEWQNHNVDQVKLWTWSPTFWTKKCIGTFLAPSYGSLFVPHKRKILCRYNDIYVVITTCDGCRYNEILSRYNDFLSRYNDILSRYND